MTKVSCPTCSKPILECRRYRLEPLAEYMRLSMSATCIAIRVSGSSQRDARCHGITRKLVDRIAGELKVHPAEIWPEVVDHDIDDASVECLADNCSERFVPDYPWQKFCSKRCRRRTEIQRERSTEAGRARNRRQSKAWRESCPGYVKSYRDRYAEENRERINAERREQRAKKRSDAA